MKERKGRTERTGRKGNKRQQKNMIAGGTGERECTYWQSPSAECQQHCCHLLTQKNKQTLWLDLNTLNLFQLIESYLLVVN